MDESQSGEQNRSPQQCVDRHEMEILLGLDGRYNLNSKRSIQTEYSKHHLRIRERHGIFDRFRVGIKKIRQEKDYSGLILALDDDDPGSRADAARTLSALGPSIIPNLLGALENAAPVSRVRMAEALVSIGTSSIPLILALIVRASPALQASFVRAIAATDGEYFSALLSSLHSEESTTRTAAVIALRGTGKKAIPHLVRRLQDRNHSVRKEAASSLAALGWVPNDPQEKVQYYYLLEDWTELAKLQGAAVPVLIKGLNSKDPRIRSESARTLGKIRDPGLFRHLSGRQTIRRRMSVHGS